MCDREYSFERRVAVPKKSKTSILCILIVPLVASIGNRTAEAKQIALKSTKVGIVTSSTTSIHSHPDTTSERIGTAKLGDIFFVTEITHPDKDVWAQRWGWHRIALPSGRLGWVAGENFQLQDISFINGEGRKDDYGLWDSLPDGKVIATRSKREPFAVLEYKMVRHEGYMSQFYKVQYFNEYGWYTEETGWVRASDVSLSYEILLWHAGQHLADWWQDMEWDAEADLDAAEGVFRLLLERYPEKQFIDRSDEYGGELHAGVVALESLARLQVEKKEYAKAIQLLEQIIKRFPSVQSGPGIAGGLAKQRIADIYRENIRDPYRAIDIYQRIVKEYPEEEIGGFEWNSTLDIEAIGGIIETGEEFGLSDSLMLEQYRKAIGNAGFPVVKVIAHIERAKVLRNKGRFSEAIEELTTAISRYPSSVMVFFKTAVHYGLGALDLLCRICAEDLEDPVEARRICQSIYDENRDTNLARGAMFLKAEILDNSIGDRGQVIREYEILVKYFRGWGVASPDRGWEDEIGTYLATKRMAEIRSFKPKRGIVQGEDVSLFERADFSAKVTEKLDEGSEIAALYNKEDGEHTWYKVRTDERTIGWVEESQIAFLLEPLLSEGESYSSWAIGGANDGHTRSIQGRAIKSPVLRGFISNVQAREVVFTDANRDGILDLVVCGLIDKTDKDQQQDIVVIDSKTQEVIWKFKAKTSSGYSSGYSSPIVYEGVLCCAATDGTIYGLDVYSGQAKWEYKASSGIGTSPVSYGECICVGCGDNYLYAVRKNSGALAWKLELDGPIASTPVVKDNRLYCAVGGDILCIDLKTRKTLWKYPTGSYIVQSSPTILGPVLVCGANDRCLHALEIKDGRPRWKYKTRGPITSSPAVKGNLACVVSSDGNVYAVEISSGRLLWKFTAGGQFRASPCIVGDVLYAGSHDGYLYALRLCDGQMLWKYEIGAPIVNSISAVGPVLCVNSNTNYLYLIGEKEK